MKKSIFNWLAFAIIVLLFNSCSKNGEMGPAGKDGNANVSSNYYTVSSWNGPASGKVYADISDADITQSVIDSGSVMVYLYTSNSWSPLPYNQYFSDHFIATTFQYSVGIVRVIVTESDLTNPPQDVLSLKVVAIAGQ